MPPGKSTHIAEPLTFNRVIRGFEVFPPGWKPNSTSARMADATVLKQGLRMGEGVALSALILRTVLKAPADDHLEDQMIGAMGHSDPDAEIEFPFRR